MSERKQAQLAWLWRKWDNEIAQEIRAKVPKKTTLPLTDVASFCTYVYIISMSIPSPLDCEEAGHNKTVLKETLAAFLNVQTDWLSTAIKAGHHQNMYGRRDRPGFIPSIGERMEGVVKQSLGVSKWWKFIQEEVERVAHTTNALVISQAAQANTQALLDAQKTLDIQ